MSDNEGAAIGICCLLIFMIAGAVWLWQNHPVFAYGLVIIILLVATFAAQRWYKVKKTEAEAKREATRLAGEQRKRREQFEREQLARGFVRFVDRDGNERWGTPEQVKEWQQEEKERERLEKAVVVREKETIIKEIVKVRCPYCGKLYGESLDKCPYCGASR